MLTKDTKKAKRLAELASRFAYLPYQAMQLVEDQAEITDNRANFQ